MRTAQSVLVTLLISNVFAQGLLGDIGNVVGGGGGSAAESAAATTSPSNGQAGSGESQAPDAQTTTDGDPGLLDDPLAPIVSIANGADSIVQPPATPPARQGRPQPSADQDSLLGLTTDLLGQDSILNGNARATATSPGLLGAIPIVSPVANGVNSQLNGGGNDRNGNGHDGILGITSALTPIASPITDTLGKATKVVGGVVSNAGDAVSEVTHAAGQVVSTLKHAAESAVRTGAPDLVKTVLPGSEGGDGLLDPVLGNSKTDGGLLPTVGSILHSVVSNVRKPATRILGDHKHPGLLPSVIDPILGTNTGGLIPVITHALPSPIDSIIKTIPKVVQTIGGGGGLPDLPVVPDPPVVLTNPGGILTNPGGVLTNPGGILTNPGGVLTNPGGVLTNPGGILTNPGGVLTNPGGILTNPGGILTNPGGIVTNPGGILTNPVRPITSILDPNPPQNSPPPPPPKQNTRPQRPSRPQPSPIVPEMPPNDNQPSQQPNSHPTPEVPPVYPPSYPGQPSYAPPQALPSYHPEQQPPPVYQPSASPPESGPSYIPEHPIESPYPPASYSDAAPPAVDWTSTMTFHFEANTAMSASKSKMDEAKETQFTTKHQTYTLEAQTLAANAGSSMLVLPTGALPDSDSQIGSAPSGKVLSHCMLGLAGLVLGGMVLF